MNLETPVLFGLHQSLWTVSSLRTAIEELIRDNYVIEPVRSWESKRDIMLRLENLQRETTREEVKVINERFQESGYAGRVASGGRRADQAAAANVEEAMAVDDGEVLARDDGEALAGNDGGAMAVDDGDVAPRASVDLAGDEPAAGHNDALEIHFQQIRQQLQEASMAGSEQINALQRQLQQIRQQSQEALMTRAEQNNALQRQLQQIRQQLQEASNHRVQHDESRHRILELEETVTR
ncbi:hypothetical protein EAF04_002725 [Stromatinia cepivora]|nr:hypothetical protein EAF04_002725 [Stromatinia cepivora]